MNKLIDHHGRAALVATLALACAAHRADAFCGFYVAGGDQQMFNDATQVVLMRKGTRTVLSMQNNYKGPPDAFAMVIPVPVVLHEGDVKTLPHDVFAHVEQMGAPRLVEYWEQDPCAPELDMEERTRGIAMPSAAADKAEHGSGNLGVTIEAKFTVGEYQIVILSAKDSTGLDTWLRQEKYNIPAGAEPLLRPYVEAGEKFFVAKVDPQKVKFVDGRAALSPLRFHYDTDHFELPIRLGLANSSGTQDLIVNILAPSQRYEVANYPNVTIPTNLDVKDSVKDKFGAFYTALFDRTVEKHPGAVVTEYAWQATTCDPCPGPALGPADFQLLGADVLDQKPGGADAAAEKAAADALAKLRAAQKNPNIKPQELQRLSSDYMRLRNRMPRPNYYGYDFVLTRLHARYGKDIKDDLVFKAADPIVGGREHVIDPQTGKLEEGAQTSSMNNFQGRYAIRHEWTGPIQCAKPLRHRWGGPPAEVTSRPDYRPTGTQPALGLAFAPRGQVKVMDVVTRGLPEIDAKAPAPAPAPTATPPTGQTPAAKPKKSGCGCQTGDGRGGLAFGLVGLGVVLALRRRRRA